MTADLCCRTPARARSGHGIRFLFAITLVCQTHAIAQAMPTPPCGMEPDPTYPGLGNPPIVKFWNEPPLSRDWKPPACTNWADTGFSTLVTTIGRFRYATGTDGLLRQIGAISKLAGMRYWSSTHKQWQKLIVNAHALTGPPPSQQRQDFSPDEIRDGKLVYFEQVDNLSGTAIYRMHVSEASPGRIVFEIENVSVMRRFYVTLFRAGEVQSIYFLDRESDEVWRYYSLIRTGRNASWLATGHPSSSINRAVAFYRALAGIPTDQEPPAAR